MWRNLVWMAGKGEIGGLTVVQSYHISDLHALKFFQTLSLNVQNSVFVPKCILGITLVLNYSETVTENLFSLQITI